MTYSINREIRATDFGDTASASGYGYSRYVDCNSALALLGFILFVDILRDIVEYITTQRRRKRWVAADSFGLGAGPEPDILSFIADGGVEHLHHALPNIVVPLLDGWQELSDSEEPRDCLHQSVCQANAVLAQDYGGAGRVFATLLSNMVSHAFLGSDEEGMRAALNAARTGRRKESCELVYPACPGLHSRQQQPRYSNHTL